MKEKIRELIRLIKTGDTEQSRTAKKALHKLRDSSDDKVRALIAAELTSEMRDFDSIENTDNRANFIYSLGLVFLSKIDTHFDFFMDFLIERLQDKNGKIRNAALNVAKGIYPIPSLRHKIEQRMKETEKLLEKYCQPKFKRCKYVQSLPPGIYKSLQMLMHKLSWVDEYFVKKDLFSEHKNDKWELYYDAMQFLDDEELYNAEEFLERALELDKDFVNAYVGLTEVYKRYDDEKEEEYAEIAWQKTLKEIAHRAPNKLIWGVTDDRQYLRAICNKAAVLHKKGNKAAAEKIYRMLLKMNPGDNQGARYLLAALFRGLMPDDVDRLTDEGNRKQNWSKLENIVREENAKHDFLQPDDDDLESGGRPDDDFDGDEYPEDDLDGEDDAGDKENPRGFGPRGGNA